MGDKNLLLEILLHPAMTQASGMRVYEDGTYRYMQGDRGWYDVWRYTDEEMVELRQAIMEADIPSLASRYDAQLLVSDGTTTSWNVYFEGLRYQILVAPGVNVPALDKLFHTFSTLRKLSPESSEWHVWQPGGIYREFTVLGSVNAVDILRPLIVALFIPQSAPDTGELAVSPDTLLVKTKWITEDKTELTRLYADGRYIREVDGKREESKLGAAQVLNVLSSIRDIDWSAVPDKIDTT